MKLKPVNQYILVRPVSGKVEMTEGGIAIPEALREYPSEGIVLAVGSGPKDKKGRRVAIRVAPGARILYQRNSGFEFDGMLEDDGAKVLLLEEADILATI